MVSDGDSSAFETIKHTYVNLLLKDLVHSNSLDNPSSVNTTDNNISDGYNNSLSQLSEEQYESNLVTKEDCINHVKKRVSNHLKTMKSRYTGFEDVHQQNLASAIEQKKHIEVKKHVKSYTNARSSSDDDDNIPSFAQPIGKSRKRRRRLADGKPYGGADGRMTKVMEHKLADCYGLAIRQSSESAKGKMIVL
jgi:ribosomal protein S18